MPIAGLMRCRPTAAEALKRIGALYAIEKDIQGKSPEVRQAARAFRASPLLASLHAWLQETLRSLSQKSALAEAIRYVLKLWTAFVRYTANGLIEIDNNAAERALLTVALGRKNFSFAGSDTGGERRCHLKFDRLGEAQRHRPRNQSAFRHHAHRRASGQSGRQASPLGGDQADRLAGFQLIFSAIARRRSPDAYISQEVRLRGKEFPAVARRYLSAGSKTRSFSCVCRHPELRCPSEKSIRILAI